MADLDALRDLLVGEGLAMLEQPLEFVSFSGQVEADALLNDLNGYPHAFLFACLVDRQITAERAWMLPYKVWERLGTLEMADLVTLSETQWVDVLRTPTSLHRLPETMATVLFRATQRVASDYSSDASLIWSDTPSSATIVRRFLQFHGAGPKIATMAANILVRNFHIELRDHFYIDISADSQVQRVMTRLGYVEPGSKPEIVIYTARELNAIFPGIFDLALWDIGRTVCRPKVPLCSKCRLAAYCDYAKARGK